MLAVVLLMGARSAAADVATQLAFIEKQIIEAEAPAEVQRLARKYLDTACGAEFTVAVSRGDERRIQQHVAAAAKKDVTLEPLVGRHNIFLCEPEVAEALRAANSVPLADLTYVLIQRLFGYDPMLRRGYRMLHRFDPAQPREHARQWYGELAGVYPASAWRTWATQPDALVAALAPEITHAFVGNMAGRSTFWALPAGDRGWPHWGTLYALDHLAVLDERFARRHRAMREAVDTAIESHMKSAAALWSIDDAATSAGLIMRLIAAAARDGDGRDPYGPARRALTRVGLQEDRMLEEHRPLEVLRFVTALADKAPDKLYAVAAQAGCRITADDARTYRAWLGEVVPVITAVVPRGTDPEVQRKTEAALARIAAMPDKTPMQRDLREQALLALCRQVSLTGRFYLMPRIERERAFMPDWVYAGPFQTGDPNEALDKAQLHETATTRAAMIAGVAEVDGWKEHDFPWHQSTVKMEGALGRYHEVAGYACATIEVSTPTRMAAFIKADDFVKIWLNGELLGDVIRRDPRRTDEQAYRPLALKAGKNTILVKVVNADGTWGFYFRLAPGCAPD